MKAYSASNSEALRIRDLLKDWAGEGFLSAAQYQRMEQETVCDLRRTNIFLRLVLFLFTLIIVGAVVGLFFSFFFTRPAVFTGGVFLVIFAAISYAAAEFAVLRGRLYRHGIEEALAACSVGFLCVGLQGVLFNGPVSSSKPPGMAHLVPAAGIAVSLWIWHRFGLLCLFVAAMIFVLWLPGNWTSPHWAQHLAVAALYSAGLLTVAVVSSRQHFAYRDAELLRVEALLWLGIYLAINLELSSANLFWHWWGGRLAVSKFPKIFFWATWLLTWCMPPAVLWRGLHRKNRYVMAVGAIALVLTLVTNTPYLGWQRHSWEPMLLGALLIGVALMVHRWLASGPGGIRYGFTAQRLFGKKGGNWMTASSAAFGFLTPQAATSSTQPDSPGSHFGGGKSGGGGASADF